MSFYVRKKMSGPMFIAVRTNDGSFLYADGYSRSSYNVFSYAEIFDGDDTKAIEFIREWNKGEKRLPTEVRPLEYGAVVVDFKTKQIFKDSFEDTNICLMTYLGGGPFIEELERLGRTRRATPEEKATPIFDDEGRRWDGTGEKPTRHSRVDKQGGETVGEGFREYYSGGAIYIDYSPWQVHCFPETKGGRVAFVNAVEACGFPIRREFWTDGRPRETEERENDRHRSRDRVLNLLPQLKATGVKGQPLWRVTDDGAFSAHILLEFSVGDAGSEFVLVPITLSADARIKPVCRIVGAWHPDETLYTDGATTFTKESPASNDEEMLPFFSDVGRDEVLDLLACHLLGADERNWGVLSCMRYFFEDDKRNEEIAVGHISVLSEDDICLPEKAATPPEEIERVRREAERRLRSRWAVFEGEPIHMTGEPHWGVKTDHGPGSSIKIGPSLYGGNGCGVFHGFFGVERRAEAFAYAERLLELGCGPKIEVLGDIEIITPGVARAVINHGNEIQEMAKSLSLHANFGGRRRKSAEELDPALREMFRQIHGVVAKHKPQWEDISKQWPLDAEWRALWTRLSGALGEVTVEKLASLPKTENSWNDPAYFWRLKAALDFVTFGKTYRRA
jgi:hypothetical protein